MDIQTISQVFVSILSGNQQLIKDGTDFIEQQRSAPNFTIILMELINNVNADLNIRQFAATTLSNTISKMWVIKNDKPSIPIQDKQIIVNNLLPNIIAVANHRQLYKQYEKIIYTIQQKENKPIDQQVATSINQILTFSDDFHHILGCLLYFKSFAAVYEYCMKEDSQLIQNGISLCFEGIQAIAAKIITNYNPQTQILMSFILKIFNVCTHMDFPDYLKNNFNLLGNWIGLFKVILEVEVSPLAKKIPKDYQDELTTMKMIEWKNKKLAGKIMMRLIQKYSNKNIEKSSQFPDFFLNNYSLIFLDLAFQILFLSRTQYISIQVIHYQMRYIYFSMRHPELVTKMLPYLEKILYDVCIPMLQLQQKDIELFENDPQEFIRKEEDFSQLLNNPKNSTMDLIDVICKQKGEDGESFLHKMMKFYYFSLDKNKFQHNDQAITPQQKDGILWSIGKLRQQILGDSQLTQSIENVLERFVLPLFDSPYQFLQARACNLYGEFNTIIFKNQYTVKHVTEKLKLCLLNQNQIIKLKAAISINFMLKQKDTLELLRPELSQILKIYLQIIEIVENESIVSALEGIIENFSNDITPFAVELCQTLKNQFMIFYKKELSQDSDGENTGEAELAAAGVLNAIIQILKSPLKQEVYQQLFFIVYPLIDIGISDNQTEFVDEALDILGIFVYKQNVILPQQWFYYSAIIYLVIGLPDELDASQIPHLNPEQIQVIYGVKSAWGMEFSDRIVKCLKNFIKKGGNIFLNENNFLNTSHVQLLNNLIAKSTEIGSNSVDDIEMANFTQLWMVFIENYIGQIDIYIPEILKNTLIYLNQNQDKSQIYKVTCFGVVSLCFFYNPLLSFYTLNQLNVTGEFFTKWLEVADFFKKEYDLQRLMLGFSSIFKLPENQIPEIVYKFYPLILKKIVQLTSQILEVRFQDEDDKTDKENDDDDDEDFDDSGCDSYLYLSYGDNYDCSIESTDEILHFQDILKHMQVTNPQMFTNVVGLLTSEETAKLEKNFAEANATFNESQQENKI